MKKEREGESENEREKRKMKEKSFSKMFEGSSNPPDELAQNVSEKIPFGRIIPLLFSSKVQNLTLFLNYLHDSNSIFRARRIFFRMGFRPHSNHLEVSQSGKRLVGFDDRH